MAISKTHEKGFTVYCKETRKDLKSLMNKYIKKEISGKPLSSGNALRSVELVEYNSQKFIELYLRPFLFPTDQEAGQAPAGNAHLYCRSLLCC